VLCGLAKAWYHPPFYIREDFRQSRSPLDWFFAGWLRWCSSLHLLYDQWMESQWISPFPSYLPTNKCRSNWWTHYPLFKQWMLNPFPSSASPTLEPSLPCLLILTPWLWYQRVGAFEKALDDAVLPGHRFVVDVHCSRCGCIFSRYPASPP
jgi:hypothetical protein